MNAVYRAGAAVVIAAVVAIPASVLAQIAAGTTMTGTLDRELSSKHATVGEPFKLTNLNSHAYEVNGATAYGHVSQVQSGGAGRKGELKLTIDKINTRSGNIYKVVGYTTNVKVNTKSNALREGGAAGAGALVGGLLLGGWGAVIGGTGGFLVAKNVHQDVTIPANAIVTFEVSSAHKQKAVP